MKHKFTIFTIILCLILIGIVSCSSKSNTINGTYISLYDESSYLSFNSDGSLTSSLWTDNDNKPLEHFTYSIDENGFIISTDTTEYENHDELLTYDIGYLYDKYICYKYDGNISYDNESTISYQIPNFDVRLFFTFKPDGTYSHHATSDGKTVDAEEGTYSVNNDVITCTSNDNKITTFFNTDNGILCAEYVSEK